MNYGEDLEREKVVEEEMGWCNGRGQFSEQLERAVSERRWLCYGRDCCSRRQSLIGAAREGCV